MRRGKFVKIGAAESGPRGESGRKRPWEGFWVVGFFFNAERKISAERQHGINVEFVEILRVIVSDRQRWPSLLVIAARHSLSFTSDWSFSSLSVDRNPTVLSVKPKLFS